MPIDFDSLAEWIWPKVARRECQVIPPIAISSVVEWWDPYAGIVIGTGVASWTGRKQGLVMAQGSGPKQPTYAANAGNGVPGLTFVSASAQTLAFNATVAGYLSNLSAYTLFINVRFVTLFAGTFPTLFCVCDAAGGNDARFGAHVAGTGGQATSFRVLNAAQQALTTDGGYAANTRYTYTTRWAGAGVPSFWKNTTLLTNAVAQTFNIATQIAGGVGATFVNNAETGNYLNGVMGDVVLANAALSDSDVAAMQAFLATRRP